MLHLIIKKDCLKMKLWYRRNKLMGQVFLQLKIQLKGDNVATLKGILVNVWLKRNGIESLLNSSTDKITCLDKIPGGNPWKELRIVGSAGIGKQWFFFSIKLMDRNLFYLSSAVVYFYCKYELLPKDHFFSTHETPCDFCTSIVNKLLIILILLGINLTNLVIWARGTSEHNQKIIFPHILV